VGSRDDLYAEGCGVCIYIAYVIIGLMKQGYGGYESSERGFTLVELLIVIVIIATLASITVMAFNGLSQRAKGNQISSALKAYEKAFKMYRAEHGVYPHTPGYHYSCMGQTSDYPAVSGWPQGECGFSGETYPATVDADLNAALKVYIGTLPAIPSLTTTYADGDKTRGVYYEGNETYYYFEYGLPNGQTCPYGSDAWSGDEVLCTTMSYIP